MHIIAITGRTISSISNNFYGCKIDPTRPDGAMPAGRRTWICYQSAHLFFIKSFWPIRAIAGLGGVIGPLPRPKQRWANHLRKWSQKRQVGTYECAKSHRPSQTHRTLRYGNLIGHHVETKTFPSRNLFRLNRKISPMCIGAIDQMYENKNLNNSFR